MKKVVALFLIVVMCLSTTACANSTATLEEETLSLLNETYKYSRGELLALLAAWEYVIDFNNASILERQGNNMFDNFCKKLCMTEDDIIDAFINGLKFTWDIIGNVGTDGETRSEENGLDKVTVGYGLSSLKISFFVAKYFYAKKILHTGTTYAIDLDAQLDQIKGNLKQLKDTSDNYDTLQDYYLVICEIKNWVDNPSGSYEDISDASYKYDREVNAYKNKLELAIG